MKMNPVVHFEIPADDTARMSTFYQQSFGWKTNDLGEGMGGYVLASTTESDETVPGARTPKEVGRINGGFYQKKSDSFIPHPSIVIAVDDITESMAKVIAAGGTIHGEPIDIPSYGTYVSFTDTEGNRLSMIEPTMPMKDASH